MIKAINFLGKPDAPGSVSKVSAAKPEAKDAAKIEPAKDTFEKSKPKAEEAVKADANDKFEKSGDKKSEEKKD